LPIGHKNHFAYKTISPTGHLAYWTVRLQDISPTASTVRLPTDCSFCLQDLTE